jgi:4-aminobutyrate aminotransferase/(S)-3-amino-2-methylpropionate transaminase
MSRSTKKATASGTSSDEILRKDRKYIAHGGGRTPIVFVKAKGSIVTDANGKEYIDCVSMGMGTSGVGHNHPRVVEAIREQAGKIIHTHLSTVNIPSVELGEKLARITPHGLNKFHFVNSGTDANETAIRAAMTYTKKKEVLSLELGYHGTTIALSSLGMSYARHAYPTVPGFRQLPPPYCYRCPLGLDFPRCDVACANLLDDAIKYATSHDVAAFILEPIMGAAGHIVPPGKEYAKIIRETCDRHDILIIADEIQTGLGRTGTMWASDYIGLKPDIMTLGKGLGGGMPIGAAVFSEEVGSMLQKGTWAHGYTHSESPMSCAAAGAVVDIVVDEKLPERSAKLGAIATKIFKQWQSKYEAIGDVRGPGLFIGLELVKNKVTKERATEEATKIAAEALEMGGIFSTSHGASQQPGGNVVKFKPPMTIEEDLMKKGIDILDDAFTQVLGRAT